MEKALIDALPLLNGKWILALNLGEGTSAGTITKVDDGVKTVEDIFSDPQKLMTIENLNAIQECNRKANISEDVLFCNYCKGKAKHVAPRFKIEVAVTDFTGTATFILFDREALEFVGKRVLDLQEGAKKEVDVAKYPQAMNVLLNRTFLFQARKKQFNINTNVQTYSVVWMTDKKEILEPFVRQYEKLQELDDQEINVDSVTEANAYTKSSSAVSNQESWRISSANVQPCKKRFIHSESDSFCGELSSTIVSGAQNNTPDAEKNGSTDEVAK